MSWLPCSRKSRAGGIGRLPLLSQEHRKPEHCSHAAAVPVIGISGPSALGAVTDLSEPFTGSKEAYTASNTAQATKRRRYDGALDRRPIGNFGTGCSVRPRLRPR